MQNGERTFPNFLAVPGQTTPGRLTVTKWRFTVRPWPENENLPLPANASRKTVDLEPQVRATCLLFGTPQISTSD